MSKLVEHFILAFIPIFVAVDAIGNIPLFFSLVEGMNKNEKRRAVIQAVITATVVALLFIFIGKAVLRFIGITIPDFQIAGGALLFIISTRLLLPGATKTIFTSNYDKEVGVFPLGMPLITGPAVLTTALIVRDAYGLAATVSALLVNMLFVWVSLRKAGLIMSCIGDAGLRAFSKIMYIVLAAIGVMMIRKGLTGIVTL